MMVRVHVIFLIRVAEGQPLHNRWWKGESFSDEFDCVCTHVLVRECKDLQEVLEMGMTKNLFGRILGELNDGKTIGVCIREVKDSMYRHGEMCINERCQAKGSWVAEL